MVARMEGATPWITLRPFRSGDLPEARRIFAAGLLDLPRLAFRNAFRSPVAPGLLAASWALVYEASCSPAWATLSVVVLLALLYLACWSFFARYVRTKLGEDMADIQGSYADRPGAGFWVAEDSTGVLRGIVAARPALDEPGTCELLRLSVDRHCRGRGLGRRLAGCVVEFARDRGFRECVLCASTPQLPALRLYRSAGFQITQSRLPLLGPAPLGWLTNVYGCELRRSLGAMEVEGRETGEGGDSEGGQGLGDGRGLGEAQSG